MTEPRIESGGDHTPESEELPEDASLGGYFAVHKRPPAFEGSDGRPYTVSVETEQVGDLTRPFAAYLVFPRWTHDGSGVVGHVQTPLLAHGRSRAEVEEAVGRLPLERIKELLEDAIRSARERQNDESDGPAAGIEGSRPEETGGIR